MKYKVNKQYIRGPEMPCAEFDDLNDAKLFIKEKLAADVALNVKVTYRIYHLDQLINEYDSSNVVVGAQETTVSGKGQAAAFRPTPFNTTPRPPGTPPRWLVDEDDEEKNED